MKEIRVLHVDTEHGWRGGQQQAYYLHQGLCNLGVTSGFVCRKSSEMESRLKRDGLPVKAIPFLGEGDLIAAYRLAAYARRNAYNILHLHSSHALGWGILARLFAPKLKLVAAAEWILPFPTISCHASNTWAKQNAVVASQKTSVMYC